MARVPLQEFRSLAYAAGALLSTLVAIFLSKLYVHRSQFLRLKRQGLVSIRGRMLTLLILSKIILTLQSLCHPIIRYLAIYW